MADEATALPDDHAFLRDLSARERDELERRQHLRRGDEVLWIEPDGRLRREPVSNVYYIQTARGVFRLSRITKEVVEV